MTDTNKSLDVLGLKPVADAVSTVTTATTAGVSAFLSRICLPAAEEFGLLLRDRVSTWRAKNAVAIAEKAEALFEALPNAGGRHAHPRIVGAVLDHGSWADEDDVRGMWAGLLASACTESGRSQENLIYVNLLAQLTTSQARILSFACLEARKGKYESGLIVAEYFAPTLDQIVAASGTSDIHSLDLEIDHLREIGLLDGRSGLSPHKDRPPTITPSAIALQLYVRCQGYVGSPADFFKL